MMVTMTMMTSRSDQHAICNSARARLLEAGQLTDTARAGGASVVVRPPREIGSITATNQRYLTTCPKITFLTISNSSCGLLVHP